VQIWPQVKLSHTNASVCEIGAIIGHMWNDLNDAEKKRYNDNYALEKVETRYFLFASMMLES